ncbi:LOW QUALITY PROTEIN: la-related protein 7-like [Ptychodera flava]|uniref:LOW QUALITY PROTEIN: la-related protein 7-like n=1 Tax=Ptychodera flava TaxID=63121 RepID=UPI003969D916
MADKKSETAEEPSAKTTTEASQSKSHNKKKRKRVKKLVSQIKEQLEFYFGDANLRKDRFLKQEMESNDGFVKISTLLTFNKLKTMTEDEKLVSRAAKISDRLKVNNDGSRIGRSKPLTESKYNIDDLTVYVECLPKTTTHDWLKSVFSSCGKVTYVSIPRFKSTGDIKGFAFIEFETPSEAEKACKMLNNPPEEAASKVGKFPKTRAGKPVPLQETETAERESKDIAHVSSDRKRKLDTEGSQEQTQASYPVDSKDGLVQEKPSKTSSVSSDGEGKARKRKRQRSDGEDSRSVAKETKERDEESDSKKRRKKEKSSEKKGKDSQEHQERDRQEVAADQEDGKKREKERDRSPSPSQEQGSGKRAKKHKRDDIDHGGREKHRKHLKDKDHEHEEDRDKCAEHDREGHRKHDKHDHGDHKKHKKHLKEKDHEHEGDHEKHTESYSEERSRHETHDREQKHSRKRKDSKHEDSLENEKWEEEKRDEKDDDDSDAVHRTRRRVNKKDSESKVCEKPKRKRNKKKKIKSKERVDTPRLRVLPKKEWLELKTEYLQLQKANMAQLKKDMVALEGDGNKKEENEETKETKERPSEIPFTKGVVIKFESIKAIATKRILREQLANIASVAYIDMKDGDKSGLVRFQTPEGAKLIVEHFSSVGKEGKLHTALLSGDEEKQYWEKINTDRNTKLSSGKNSKRAKKKGLERVLSKANRMSTANAASRVHIRFDDGD